MATSRQQRCLLPGGGRTITSTLGQRHYASCSRTAKPVEEAARQGCLQGHGRRTVALGASQYGHARPHRTPTAAPRRTCGDQGVATTFRPMLGRQRRAEMWSHAGRQLMATCVRPRFFQPFGGRVSAPTLRQRGYACGSKAADALEEAMRRGWMRGHAGLTAVLGASQHGPARPRQTPTDVPCRTPGDLWSPLVTDPWSVTNYAPKCRC